MLGVVPLGRGGQSGLLAITLLAAVLEMPLGIAAAHSSPAPVEGVLYGVACVNGSSCFAVGAAWPGASQILNPGVPLVEHWNGSGWSVVPVPLGRPDVYGALYGISCHGPHLCMAVGTASSEEPYSGHTLEEEWRRGEWQELPTGGQPRGYGQLVSVSCPEVSNCETVGGFPAYAHGEDNSVPLAEHWDGTSWRVVQLPQPQVDGVPQWLVGVGCVGPKRCFGLVNADRREVVDAWNGRSWSADSHVSRSLPVGPHFVGISCPSDSGCVLMDSRAFNSQYRTLLAFWGWSGWVQRWSANPAAGAAGTCFGAGAHGVGSFYLGYACLTGFT